MEINLNNLNVNKLLSEIYSYEFEVKKDDIEIEEKVKSKWLKNSVLNNIKFTGDLPVFTLYNLEKSKERILELDEDGIFGIVGRAGEGKTSVSLLNSIYLDKDFKSSKVILNLEHLTNFLSECAKEIEKEELDVNYKSYLRGCSVIIDEGVSLLFSADANTKIGKLVTKLFTVIRYLNLIIFINLTNFERLNKTIRTSRLYGVIKIISKGIIEFYSKKKTQMIKVDDNLDVDYPEPSFIESVGYVDKDNKIWTDSLSKKSKFVLSVIKEVQEEVRN